MRARSPRRGRTLAALAVVAGLSSALGARASGATEADDAPGVHWIDYLHVEANEGGASGGHVAIRFAAQTFHFQYHEGGVLRLHRDDSDGFLHTYAGLQNRDVHVRRIAVSPETYALLRTRFNDRYLSEARQFALLDALRAERELREALAAAEHDGDRAAPPTLELRGVGLFATGARDLREADARPLGSGLRAAVERRRAEVARGLAELAQAPGGTSPDVVPAVAPQGHRTAEPLFARRARELLEGAAALDVLERRAPLARSALRSEEAADLALAPDEVAVLERFAAALDERVAALLESRRPDWGSTLLLALARREAVRRSVASRRLVVLDAYPADATRLSRAEVASHADVLPRLLADARSDLAAARRALRGTRPPAEADYAALETAANRFVELHEARAHGRGVRVAPGPLVPGRSARVPLPHEARPAGGAARLALDAARAAEERYAAELRQIYAYDLLARNCVSEIFREIEGALAGIASDGDACREAERRLGGCVPPSALPGSIPFVSARNVGERLAVRETEIVPSHRKAELAAMYERENDLAVFLRESNVVTSTIYRVRAEDSAFLFFTDDAPLLRPLLGVANLATGIGAGAAGLLLLPAGDPDLLVGGIRGVLFSLPELAFVSVRKGSFDHVPRRPGTR